MHYEHGTTVFHRLDPRSKLVGQFGFAIAAFGHTETAVLVVLTLLAGLMLALARLSPVRVLRTYWFALVLLGLAPLFAMFQPSSPWIVPERALSSVVAGYQVILVLLVAAVYVRTTPVRDTRGAIQRHVPGRVGQILGVGIALVFRFFPLVLRDVAQSRLAIRARKVTGCRRGRRYNISHSSASSARFHGGRRSHSRSVHAVSPGTRRSLDCAFLRSTTSSSLSVLGLDCWRLCDAVLSR